MKKVAQISAACATMFIFGALWVPQARADGFTLGDAANFAVLYEGNGNNQLSTTNVTINGNIGIGDPSGVTTAFLSASGGLGATINGNVFYAGAVSPRNSINNTTFTGTVAGGNTNVQTDLNTLNKLSSDLGAEAGTNTAIALSGSGGTQTIHATSGILTKDASGNIVFNLTSVAFNNNNTLVIDGDGLGHNVVFNISSNAQFGGAIVLTGGLTADNVLFNFTGGSNLTGGSTASLNNNGQGFLTGIFLDPNGAMSVVHTNLNGRIFGGDSSNLQIVSGDTINSPASAPEPSSLALLATGMFGLIGFARRRKVQLA